MLEKVIQQTMKITTNRIRKGTNSMGLLDSKFEAEFNLFMERSPSLAPSGYSGPLRTHSQYGGTFGGTQIRSHSLLTPVESADCWTHV